MVARIFTFFQTAKDSESSNYPIIHTNSSSGSYGIGGGDRLVKAFWKHVRNPLSSNPDPLRDLEKAKEIPRMANFGFSTRPLRF